MSKSPEASSLPAVLCQDVVKEFYVYKHRTNTLREWFIRSLLRRPIHIRELDFSLRGFELRVDPGDSVALIGRNGSGKSTALRVIAGIYTPTSGVVTTCGRIGAVIELGAGFHDELTGSENVELYASIIGLGRDELEGRRAAIAEFAGIGDFMSMPVKYYSSGMQARLAFAVAVCVEPEILLLDEVLAVGDQEFQERCKERLRRFQTGGGTLVVASHDFELVRELCQRGVWLEGGAARTSGPIDQVVDAYLAHEA